MKNNVPEPVGPAFFSVIIIETRLRLRTCAQIIPTLTPRIQIKFVKKSKILILQMLQLSKGA